MKLRRRDRWAILSLGLATAIALVDALVGGAAVIIALLVIAPFLASARLGPRPTAVVGGYAVALAVALGVPNDILGEEGHLVRVAIVAAGAAISVWVASLSARLHASRDQLAAILEGVADGVTAQDRSGRVVFANRAALAAIGYDDQRALTEGPRERVFERFEIFDEEGRPFPVDRLPGRRALRGEEPEPTVLRYRARDTDEERWSVVKATPVRDESGEVTLAITIVEDVTDQKRAENAQRFLSESSKLLAASLDYETTLRRVAELAIPAIADWCAVDVVDDGGDLVQVALATADPQDLERARELRTSYPPDRHAPRGAAHVVVTGEAELYPEIPDELLVETARDERHLELLRAVGPRSAMVVPMAARGRTLGTITFASTGSGRRFAGADLELAEELCRRAAVAVDNARLYTERSYIARALQESLLPPALPDIAGVDVAARFRAAGDGNEVGGDFYDVFDTGDSRWAVVMGDVCGKGAEAAALTALARYTLRAAAMRETRPSAILSTLNQAMVRQGADEQFCTVAFARLDCRNGAGNHITVSSGGHPLPLVLRAGGSVEAVGRPGTLLGVTLDPQLSDDTVTLERGDTLVLYTDGVTDAHAPERMLSSADLASLLRACRGLDAATIAERIERLAMGDGREEPRDDVAILVLRLAG
jgi:PAS domain S-box-containing protein